MWTYRGNEPTVLQWLDAISVGHEAHQLAARVRRRRSRALGAATVILAALSAASAFAATSVDDGRWLTVAAGVLAGFAAAVALLQTVADPADVIAAHQRAAAEYGTLRRELEQAILSERITDDRLAEIRQEWTRVESAAPSLSARASRAVAYARTAPTVTADASVPVAAPIVDQEPETTPPAIETTDDTVKELTAR
ncbi:SLATT domain-containing protein [Mumia sp. Pv 4-285]|uniref:SLATT domain-containing protein n=1 Tax=Mumia qirimensis TaxID=3234852 RepID=UPI00351D4D6F